MEEFAIDLNTAVAVQLERLSARERFAAYLELTKPRITFLIVLTAAAGFALGSRGSVDYARLLTAMVGIALLSSGIATINQDVAGLQQRQQVGDELVHDGGGHHQPNCPRLLEFVHEVGE